MTDEQNDEGARSFSRFFEGLGDGSAQAEASEILQRIGEAIRHEAGEQRGKVKASMTIKLDFVGEPNGIVAVKHDFTSKLPPPQRDRSICWTTPGGNFARQDPRQPALPFQDVSTPALVDVGGER